MADDEQARLKAERIKALLAGYYGAGAGQAAATQQGAGGDAGPTRSEDSSANVARQSQAYTAGLATLDSPAFNAERHLAQVLKSYPLEKLMVEHRSMAKEIKNLESDMQQLVYENYNKFISATDTIRAMKSNVDGMGTDMEKLKSIVDNVADKSNAVSEKLQRRSESMEQLQRVQSLLKKLQAVFDLPKKMRAALDEDVLDTAVSFYAEAQPLLKKYGGRGTFRQIAVESDQVAKEISQVLKRRLTERKDSEEQCVLLLRKLGEPDDTLMDKYLQGRSQRIKRILTDASLVVDAMAAAAAGRGLPPGVMRQIESPSSWGFSSEEGGRQQAAPPLRTFIKVIDEKFLNAMKETVVNVLRFFLQDEDAASKRKPLAALAKEVFGTYFGIIRRALADAAVASAYRAAGIKDASEDSEFKVDAAPVEEEWGAEAIAQALSTLSADLGVLSGQLPEMQLKERAAETVSGAVRHHLAVCFGAAQERVVMAVQALKAQLDSPAGSNSPGLLRRAYSYTSDVLQRTLGALMQGLRAYEGQQRLLAPWRDEFMDAVQGHLQQYFLLLLTWFVDLTRIKYDGTHLVQEALKTSGLAVAGAAAAAGAQQAPTTTTTTTTAADFGVTSEGLGISIRNPRAASTAAKADPHAAEPPKSGLVLLLAKLCTFMEQSSVPWVMETLAASATLAHAGSGGRAGDLPPAFVPGEVARCLHTASTSLLAAYVELHGRQLSLMVRRSLAATNWLNHKEPRGPRPMCDLMAERLSRAEAEVVQLVEDTGRGRADERKVRDKGGSTYDAGLALETGNVERNLAKIFREKVKVFGTVQFTQANILAAIIGVGLKSLVECVRLQTLGRAGLQQLQLDCHYLRPTLRRYTGVTAAQVVDSLLDEVVNAGVERSVDPSLLEPPVLDRILSSMDNA